MAEKVIEIVDRTTHPTDNVPLGEVWVYNLGDALYYRKGSVSSLFTNAAPPVFGEGYESFKDTVSISYNTNTLFNSHTFTTASKDAGTYIVHLDVQHEPGAANANDLYQIQIGGNIIGLEWEDEGKDTGADIRRVANLKGEYIHGGGTIDIELWAAQDGGGTSFIHGVQCFIWRVCVMALRVYTKTVLAHKLEAEIESAYPGLVETIVVKGESETHVTLTAEPTAQQDIGLNDLINAHVPSQLGYPIWDLG